jgi:serine/threonine-protein kinase
MRCASCSSAITSDSRFCRECGAKVALAEATPTETSAGEVSRGSFVGGPAYEGGTRFPAGTMLGGRYRIVGLLGRGGMGEVYRADDLTLGRPVALKFLPEEVEHDPRRLARFLNEVRVALRVSHVNVCRVHDIAQIDGRHYLSMEYVDGDDLASLLRRIGRYPTERAIQVARQLCAGLAAAHEQGVLHRDLKPANVMIDGRGPPEHRPTWRPNSSRGARSRCAATSTRSGSCCTSCSREARRSTAARRPILRAAANRGRPTLRAASRASTPRSSA